MLTIFRIFVAIENQLLLKAHTSLRQYSATEGPLKMMKNTFYLSLKAPFVLEVFFVLSFWPSRKTA